MVDLNPKETPQELLLIALEIYKEEYEGETPFNASESVVSYLLLKGLSSYDAHSYLCTVQTLYELNMHPCECTGECKCC